MSTLAVAAIAVALWGWLRPGPPKAVTSRYGLSFPRDDQAIAEAKRAQLLDPVSAEATNIVGLNLVLARRYDEAIPWLRMAIDLDPTYFYAYDILPRADEQLGRMPEGITAYQKAIEGDSTYAEHADLKTTSSKGYVAPYYIALIYAGLGDKDQALAWFERAVDDRSSLPTLFYNDARWDKLRDGDAYDVEICDYH